MRKLLAVESEEDLSAALFGSESESITEVFAGCVIQEPTPEDIAAAFVEQCREEGHADDNMAWAVIEWQESRIKELGDLLITERGGNKSQCALVTRDHARSAFREAKEQYLDVDLIFDELGLSALLEDAGSEEGKPCEG